MVIDTVVTKVIGGKEYKFSFPFQVLFECEENLKNGNIILTLAKMPPSMKDTYVLFKYALLGGGFTGEIEPVFREAINELGFQGMFEVVVEALQKSGALGAGGTKNA